MDSTQYGIYNLSTQSFLTIRFGLKPPEVRRWKNKLKAQIQAEHLQEIRPHLKLEVRSLPEETEQVTGE